MTNDRKIDGFEELGVAPPFLAALAKLGISTPTAIQRAAMPRVLHGDSVVLKSQTGSGKSIAYMLPIAQRLHDNPTMRALVLLPTRELALQVSHVAQSLCEDLSVATIYGGVEYDAQRESLARLPQLIVATPGRLEDLIGQGVAPMSNVGCMVLDEVDQMVDLGFCEAIERLSKLRDDGAQRLCVSATLGDGVVEVISSLLGGDVEVIEDRGAALAAQRIEQSAYFVEQSMMDHLLLHLIRTKQPSRAIVFCRSRKMADRLASLLRENDLLAEAIHSDRSQAAREYILERFRGDETRYLVATDMLARGIDVDCVSHVFNFGLPQNTDQYVHRIGRTGRAGVSGEAITLLCPDEKRLLGSTCKAMRQSVSVVKSHPYMTPAVTKAIS